MRRSKARELALGMALETFRERCRRIYIQPGEPATKMPLYRAARESAIDDIYEIMKKTPKPTPVGI